MGIQSGTGAFAKAVLTAMTALIAGKAPLAETRMRRFRWMPNSTRDNPFALGNVLLRDAAELTGRLGGAGSETQHRSSQRIGGAEIRGTWIKRVLDAAGYPVFQVGEMIPDPPLEWVPRVELARTRTPFVLTEIRRHWPLATQGDCLATPRLEVVPENSGAFHLEWTYACVAVDESGAWEARFDESGTLLAERDVSHRLSDALAKVFPAGPRRSDLSEVTIPQLDDSGLLSAPSLQTRSALSVQASSPERRFEFPLSDPRFDQVQAHYYADRILEWFQRRFAQSLPFRLGMRVQVGQSSNTAFYYAHGIRIGAGDGVKYAHMPRDPSVVMHEVVHAVVDAVSGLPPDGEGGGLNEAFADFFTASFLENPRMGEVASVAEPYTRTLQNDVQAAEGLAGGVYAAARFVGGTLWDLRERFGADLTEKLAFRTLARLGPGSKFADFVPALRAAAQAEIPSGSIAQLESVLARRGWPP